MVNYLESSRNAIFIVDKNLCSTLVFFFACAKLACLMVFSPGIYYNQTTLSLHNVIILIREVTTRGSYIIIFYLMLYSTIKKDKR